MGQKKEVAWVNVCGGPQRGKWWKKGEPGQSWEPLDGSLLKGVILENRNERESPTSPECRRNQSSNSWKELKPPGQGDLNSYFVLGSGH